MNKIKHYFRIIKRFAIAHKVISVIAAIIILYVGYKAVSAFTSTSGETRYVVAAVQKGTVVSTVTGSGQVSASNQIDLKAKGSGSVIYIATTTGQQIKAGTVIVKIDPHDAGISLENAQISLAKLTEPADAATMLQAKNSLASAEDSARKAELDLTAAYANGINAVSSTFVDLSGLTGDLQTLLNSPSGFLYGQGSAYLSNEVVRSYRNSAGSSFLSAQTSYASTQISYRNINASSATSSVESLVSQTYETTKRFAQTLRDSKSTIDFLQTSGTVSPTDTALLSAQTTVNNWITKIDSHLADLTSAINTIESSKNAIISTKNQVAQQSASLLKLENGPNPLDVRQQQLNVQQQLESYNDYFVKAPIDGILAAINVKYAQDVSSGTLVGTIITKEKQAVISLNEVDAAKVKAGQNVTLTFDAIDSLSIAGKVASVDYIGAVTQGVVTYNVTITFDTDDERIRPGMSVNASIATEVAQDVLIVPNSAIQTQSGTKYVNVVDANVMASTGSQGELLSNAPVPTAIEVGISDDTSTEIISGLTEGQKIVARTIAGGTKTAATQAPSIFGAAGVRTGGAGATRTTGR